MSIYLNEITAPSMADVSEKAKKFASDGAKTNGNCNYVKDLFNLTVLCF